MQGLFITFWVYTDLCVVYSMYLLTMLCNQQFEREASIGAKVGIYVAYLFLVISCYLGGLAAMKCYLPSFHRHHDFSSFKKGWLA
jgi:hypothetical protein